MSPMKYTCRYCGNYCVKKGIRNGCQKLLCTKCGKWQQEEYIQPARRLDLDNWIICYVKEGLGIRSISRILEISTNTVLNRIVKIANKIQQPSISSGMTYEVDELRTFIRFKRNGYWFISAFCRETKRIVAFTVGKRNNNNIRKVTDQLLISNARKVFTDR